MASGGYVKIYSNDGTTLLFTSTNYYSVTNTIAITETGATLINETYTYSGSKKFLGLSKSVNATEPFFAVGYSGAIGDFTFYIVEGEVEEETPTEAISITYNGETIATLEEGQTATLNCNGKKMATNIVVKFDTAGTITYNGNETSVEAGQTATLVCGGKKAVTNIVIVASEESGEGTLTDLTGTTWQVNEGWIATAGYGTFKIEGMWDDYYIANVVYIGYGFNADDFSFYPNANTIYDNGAVSRENGNSFTWYITGGKDATNPDLIAWLQANATLQTVEEEVEEMVMITGGYQFYETIDLATFPKEKIMVNFKSGANNNTDFNCMFVEDEMLYYGDYEMAYFQSWYTNEHMRVDFGDTEQAVPKSFYDWLIANATQGSDTATLITFTIDGVEYQALEGMTYWEWCNSEYNVDGYMGGGYNSGGFAYIEGMTDDTVLEDGAEYTLAFMGGGYD